MAITKKQRRNLKGIKMAQDYFLKKIRIKKFNIVIKISKTMELWFSRLNINSNLSNVRDKHLFSITVLELNLLDEGIIRTINRNCIVVWFF